MVGFAAFPSIIQFVAFLFLPESPRWLYENKSRKECEEVLSKIYNGDTEWIQFELGAIQMAHDQQKHDVAIKGSRNVIWRIVSTPSVRKALLIGCALQAFQPGVFVIGLFEKFYTGTAGVRAEHITVMENE
uniref:MFS domain-containing protein n=1 Tax=Globodera pallida TaxID=36090 RepID=A0A183CSV8_GLOPA